jgi:hypothetical protein
MLVNIRCFRKSISPVFRTKKYAKHKESSNQKLLLVVCLAYSSVLKMKAACSSDSSINFYQYATSLKTVLFIVTAMRTSHL